MGLCFIDWYSYSNRQFYFVVPFVDVPPVSTLISLSFTILGFIVSIF